MVGELVSILSLGFLLGLKHAMEPDHVIAVSTIASQSKKLWKSSLTGIFWGIGHTATLCFVGLAVILLKGEIPEIWAMPLECIVGIMLVYLGLSAVIRYKNSRIHRAGNHGFQAPHDHVHRYKGTLYVKSLFMGFVHGLAGSAAMVLLTISTVHTVWGGVLYILEFGLGTIISMLCFTTILGIPFVMFSNRALIHKAFAQITGVISTVFGFYYLYHLGVSEGLFHLWIQHI
nr:sulfite exporter TauE/SafE family protein [Bacillus sp. sid0103]